MLLAPRSSLERREFELELLLHYTNQNLCPLLNALGIEVLSLEPDITLNCSNLDTFSVLPLRHFLVF